MAISLAELRTVVRRKFQIRDLTLQEADAAIETAVRLYNRFNPQRLTGDIQTTVGEDTYNIPDGCEKILDILYVESGTGNTLSLASLTDRFGYEKEQPSMPTIRVINNGLNLRDDGEFWRQEGSEIIFSDGFAAVETLRLVYTAPHVFEAGSYDTIPVEDLDIIADLALADLFEIHAANLAATEIYSVGSERVDPSGVAGRTAAMVDRLRKRFYQKYGAASVRLL